MSAHFALKDKDRLVTLFNQKLPEKPHDIFIRVRF